MWKHAYHLQVYCRYVPKLKQYYQTMEEAEQGAIEHFDRWFPWDLGCKKHSFTWCCEVINHGYRILKVREDRQYLFKEGCRPLPKPVEEYFKNKGDGDEDFEVLYDEEGNELESID